MSLADSVGKVFKEGSIHSKSGRDAGHVDNVASGSQDPEKQPPPKRTLLDGEKGTDAAKIEKPSSEDVRIITDEECSEELGFSFPNWKKWTILTSMLCISS